MEISLVLNKDEALILFEFLSRTCETEKFDDILFDDKAEKQVLWNLEGQLQKILVEPFSPDYSEILKAARDKMRYDD